MATQMTREQYEKVYGVKPVLSTSSTPTFDTTPAPIRMTRAEYETTYGKQRNKPVQNVIQGRAAFPAQTGGAETIAPNVARSIGNLPGAAINLARATVEPIIKAPIETVKTAQEIGVGQTLAALNPVGMAAGTLKKGFEMWKEGGEAIYRNLEKNVVNTGSVKTGLGISAAEGASKIAELVINDPTLVPSLLFAPKVAQPARTTDLITDVASPVTSRIKPIQGDSALDKIEAQIFDVENNYAKTRKANDFNKDNGVASRQRIAQSNVLADSVDIDGKINTKAPGGAIDKYKEYSQIDGIEGVVRENLVRENKTINLKEVEKILTDAVLTNIDSADLITALAGVKKEIQALALRADELGEVPLYKLQDSKIATTNKINYATPPSEGEYRKTIASALKKTIENKSDFNVKEVNAVLAEYYQDIKRLENLDGRRVKGGKLGKYAASLGGTAVGMAAGSVGGGVGAAIGGVLGGEVAQAIKGRSMAGTFGKGDVAPGGLNPVLAKAAADAKAPGAIDLRVPNQKVGAPKGVKKTREIQLLEGKIAKNVEQQKVAIKAGDFALVKVLKQAYEVLVNALKAEIKRYKELSPREKQGGYIKNPLAPKKLTETEKEQTLDALNTFDETPLTVIEDGQARMEMGDTNKELRLGELKAKADGKSLSEVEIAEANQLLKDRGGLVATPQTTALLEEAKPGTTLFHGTPNTFEGKPNFPFYLTTDPDYAKVYQNPSASSLATNRKVGNAGIMTFEVNPKARVLDLRAPEGKKALEEYWSTMSMSGEQVPTKTGLPDWTEGENIAEFIEERGLPFDAVLLDEGGVPTTDGVQSRGVAFQALNERAIKQANKPTGSSALLEEAKKYKSAEEFVKAQGTPVYHGTNELMGTEISKKGFRPYSEIPTEGGNGYNYNGQGTYFGNSPLDAKDYGPFAVEAYIPKNLRLLEDSNAPTWVKEDSSPEALTARLRAEGYDGVKIPTYKGSEEFSVVIFDPEKLLTRQQLEALWSKANKNTP